MEGKRETGVDPVRANQRTLDWASIDWSRVKRQVGKMQQEIFRDAQACNFGAMKQKQKLLARSLPARLLAVRTVTETNSGRNTPGIDGRLCKTGEEKAALAESLRLKGYKPLPARVVFIPKPSGDKRRLGIPTIRDRAMQALVLQCMDPEWEAKFEPHSFGFRPGRGAVDAVAHIWHTLVHQKGRKPHPGWILDADISKCFDNISHDALLEKLGSSPFLGVIKAWLKSGAVGRVGFESIERGTPQGGVISPLLANIALDGLERQFGIFSKTGRYKPPSNRAGTDKQVCLFRYADDFIVLAPSKKVLERYVVGKVKSFLSAAGLSLNEMKTRIVNVADGFEFLGFKFQRHYRQNGAVKDLGFHPSRTRLDRFAAKLTEYVKFNWNGDVKNIIAGMNRRIRGFCNYFRWCDAHDAFAYLTHRIWQLLGRWERRRHPTRSWKWLQGHYWHAEGNSNWVFAWRGLTLVQPYTLTVQWWRWPRVRVLESPYNSELQAYWQARRRKMHAVAKFRIFPPK
jgi:RNA-directed DNA polymerase